MHKNRDVQSQQNSKSCKTGMQFVLRIIIYLIALDTAHRFRQFLATVKFTFTVDILPHLCCTQFVTSRKNIPEYARLFAQIFTQIIRFLPFPLPSCFLPATYFLVFLCVTSVLRMTNYDPSTWFQTP